MKLSSIAVPVLTVVMGLLTACATAPSQSVVERLDPNTATTLTLLKSPVELVGSANQGANLTGNPFAFIAPFETDRAGKRAAYLWVSAPAAEVTKTVESPKYLPRVSCDGRTLQLSAIDSDMSHIGLSSIPYPSPVPWNLQWYFQLPQDQLDCLSGANTVSVETLGANGAPQRFTADSKTLAPLKDFSNH